MQFTIAVFTSRNETLYFANMFKSNGMYAGVINTPKEVGRACGISVRFDERLYSVAQNFLKTKPFRSFYGFYRVYVNGSYRRIEKM